VTDCVRWLSRNRDSILKSLITAGSYTIMLIIGYALMITQCHVFFKGIEIEPSTIPFFQHELAKTSY
jgi:hypothetical protein